MQKGAQPTYFREPHILFQRAACGSRVAVWPPLIYTFPNLYVSMVLFLPNKRDDVFANLF
jgi:hypothetical protein